MKLAPFRLWLVVMSLAVLVFSCVDNTPAPNPTPVKNPYGSIMATQFDDQQGVQVSDGSVAYTDGGDFVAYKNYDFGADGAKSLSLSLAAPSEIAGKQIQVRTGSATGTLHGTLTVQSTGAWSQYQSQMFNLSTPITGIKDLYLVMVGGKDVANIRSWQFSRNALTIPTPAPNPTPAPTPTPSPGNTVNSVDTIIGDMRLPATASGRSNNEASVIFSGNAAQARVLRPQYASTINNVTSWCWPFMSRDNRASNLAVQVRYHEVYGLRASTNQWVRIAGGRPSGWRGNYTAATYELKDEVVIDNDIVQVRPGAAPRTDLVSYELWTPEAAKVIDFFQDLKAVYTSCQMRLVNVSGGAVDMSAARYAGQVGFDLWRRGYGDFQPGVTQFWGPNGRMKPITNQWQAFNTISLRPYDINYSGLPPELGMGNWTTPNPYANPPYVLTEQEVRANPPPLR